MSATVVSERASASAAPAVNKWAVAVAVSLGAMLEVIDISIVNVALPQIQSSLGATLSEIGWVVSSYAIANVIILPLSAWLGKRFGKKRYFVFSLVGFTLASILCGMATTFPMLVIARVIQGLAGGGLLAKAQAILFETFPREEQAVAQGVFSAIVIAGPTIGPTLGGYLVTNVDWRWIFFVNIPVGIGAVLMSLAALPADPETEDRSSIDFLSILLLGVGLGSLQTVLEEGNGEDWFESRFIVLLTLASIVGLVTFIYRQMKSPRPVVDLRVLRYRSLWAGSLLSVVVGMALFGALFAVPLFAQTVLGYSSQETGLLLLPSALASALAMPLVARTLQRIDPRVALSSGALILITAVFMLSRLSPQTGSDQLFWPLIIRSIGQVMMFLPLSLATLGPIPKQDIAAATGFYSLTRQLGGSIGIALLATLLTTRASFHREALVSHLSASDPLVAERLAAFQSAFVTKGFSAADAHAKSVTLLDHSVNQQALILSFADTFVATAALIALFLPLVLLLGKPKQRTGASAAH
jgi:DHA2 family multidrug resistance protein